MTVRALAVAAGLGFPAGAVALAPAHARTDPAAAQRGLAVYEQVCSSCHALRGMTFADLRGLGLDGEQIRALAASREIVSGADGAGHPSRRHALPADPLPSPPYVPPPGAAVPPDLSRIALVLPGGAPAIARILTGYHPPPPGMMVPPGSFYDPAAPGGIIAMPPPLAPGIVSLADGSRPGTEALAADVAAFLDWTAHPHREARRRVGVGVVLYLLAMSVLAFLLKRRIWSDVRR